MEAKEEVDVSCLHMVSSFLALESPDVVLSFAREFGGGSITQSVQSCIWHRCISKADLKWNGNFLKKFLKKLILVVESTGDLVLDELYEFYASRVIPLKVDDERVGNSRVLKTLSYLFPCESSGITKCPRPLKLEVQLRCSVNMLEGDTGNPGTCCIDKFSIQELLFEKDGQMLYLDVKHFPVGICTFFPRNFHK